jgi:hypothetical protein
MRRAQDRWGFTVILSCLVSGGRAAYAQERPADLDKAGQSGAPRQESLRVRLTSEPRQTVLARFDDLGSGPGPGFFSVARVCSLPCDRDLPLDGATYRVVGPGLTPSSPLVLPRGLESVDIDVRAGSWRKYVIGGTFTLIGSVYAVVGGGLLLGHEGDPAAHALVPVGATFLSIGVTALAVGIPLWLSGRTHVDVRTTTSSGVGFTASGLRF